MADSSQEGSSQSRNPSPARARSSDGESDGATKLFGDPVHWTESLPVGDDVQGRRALDAPSSMRDASRLHALRRRLWGVQRLVGGDLEGLQGQRSPASKEAGLPGWEKARENPFPVPGKGPGAGTPVSYCAGQPRPVRGWGPTREEEGRTPDTPSVPYT